MGWFREWRRRRFLRRATVDAAAWEQAAASLPLLAGLSPQEHGELRDLSLLFLQEKSLEGARDLAIDPEMARLIALQACLPILRLGLDWFEGWTSVVVYRDEFLVEHDEVDRAGVVHRVRELRSGESWERGPLILAWSDVAAGTERDGYNVVIHEVAHKLDALNGAADGFPPLHPAMSADVWSRAFGEAYDDLNRRLDEGIGTAIDPYAAESPAEFFAVVSEAFFELPALLAEVYPAVYGQLVEFYRQDPLSRIPSI